MAMNTESFLDLELAVARREAELAERRIVGLKARVDACERHGLNVGSSRDMLAALGRSLRLKSDRLAALEAQAQARRPR
jgi:hypothetical protein